MSQRAIARIVAAVLVPVALLVALLAWAGSSPPGSSPDDDYHMASIWCAGGLVEGRCEQPPNADYRRLPADLLKAARCFSFDAEQSASCPLDEGEMLPTTRGNWLDHSYPPTYYAFMNLFVTSDVSVSILLMRAVNVAIYAGMVVALFFLLPRVHRPVLVWGAAITAVPLGMFLIASINPSAWAIISASGLWIATFGYFVQAGFRKWLLAALAVVLLVMGAGARSDAAVYAAFALLVAMVLAFRPDRRFLMQALLPVGLIAVAVAFFFSAGQSAVVSSSTAVDSPFPLTTLAFINLKLLPQLWSGVFGTWGLGWLDTAMPGVVWVGSLGVFAAIVFWGLRVGGWRKLIALGASALSLVAVPMYILLHDGVIVGSYVQPRYIYPLIIIFAGIAVFGFARAGLGLGRIQLVVVAVTLALANSVALHVNLRRYITGTDVYGFNLNAGAEWWWGGPISPMIVWALGSLAFAALAAGLVLLAWPGLRAGAERGGSIGRSFADSPRIVAQPSRADREAGSTSGAPSGPAGDGEHRPA